MFKLHVRRSMITDSQHLAKKKLVFSVDIYKYCSCWYTMPADLYDCANVILEIRPKAIAVSTIPTSVLLSTALLTGPISPPGPTITLGVTSATSAASIPIALSFITIQPQPLPLSAYADATLPLAVAPVPPLITPTGVRTLPVSSDAVSITKATTTFVSQTTVTLTATITLCPPIVTNCPLDYSSYSTYTSTIHQTIYSCDGGCEAHPPAPSQTVCVPRKRVRIVKRGEL